MEKPSSDPVNRRLDRLEDNQNRIMAELFGDPPIIPVEDSIKSRLKKVVVTVQTWKISGKAMWWLLGILGGVVFTVAAWIFNFVRSTGVIP